MRGKGKKCEDGGGGRRGREVSAEMGRKRDVRKGEMGNVSERERGMRMMWKKERKEVKGWDRTVGKKGGSVRWG